MKPTTKRMVAVLGLLGVAVTGVPAVASAGSATLYELTESMKLVQRHDRFKLKHRNKFRHNIKHSADAVNRRVASAAIAGVAAPGTPLCPSVDFQSGPAGCAVNVNGKDNISLTTGLGTLEGEFATVIQGDNPVDGPEAVVLQGQFRGKMDFSPAILHEIPYGTVTGRVKVHGSRTQAPFTGVFRLPFAGNIDVEVAPNYTMTLREIFCPLSPEPNPNAPFYGGFDLAYLDFDADDVPNGRCLNIEPNELSLGAPLVRFDVRF
jgi:hypothetical protein